MPTAEQNRKYNAERLAQSELVKRDLQRDTILERIYQESYDEIQAKIDQFYIKYADQNGLSRAEAMKRVSDMDVTKFNKAAREAVRVKDFSNYTNQWLKTYNLKMKVSRLELLKSQLAVEIQNLTAKTNEVFGRARYDEITAEFKRQSGILGNSVGKLPKRLEAILDADFYGATFSDRVWGKAGLQATLRKEVFGSLNRIFTDMSGFKQERNRLAKKFNTSKENAQRLIKTEISRINTQTDLQMLKENGFTHLIYVAEAGACSTCRPLNKKAIPIEEAEMSSNLPPLHPNCRCSFFGQIEIKRKDGTTNLDDFADWKGMNSKTAGSNGGAKRIVVDKIFKPKSPEDIDSFFKGQESYQQWYNNLNKEENESLKSAVGRYTSHEHDRINSLLREGKEMYERHRGKYAYTDSTRADIEDVKKAISGFKTEKSFKTYRGVSFYDNSDPYADLEPGKNAVLDKAFMSSSLSKDEIDMFADGGREYRFEITIPKGYSKGAYISELSGMPEEKEFLFSPEAEFNIVSVKKKDNVTEVIAEALND